MIDLELLENMIKNEIILIKYFEKITLEEVNKLKQLTQKHNIENIKKYMDKGMLNPTPGTFLVEHECFQCNNIICRQISKTLFTEILKGKNIICDECKKKNKLDNKQRRKESEYESTQRHHQFIKDNTEYMINNYLNSERKFNQNVDVNQKFISISTRPVYGDQIEVFIRQMDYNDFLRTPYWDAVRSKKLQQSGFRCELCSNDQYLHVHHKTYDNHGREHNNLKDLIVLCKFCHEKFHRD